ncbi:MAG: flagellar basal body rod protein FlgB [Elusimicrobiota bacterium]
MSDSIKNIAGLGIEQHLALTWANQRSIANNIANGNTANFQAKRMELISKDQDYQLILNQSDSKHLTLHVEENSILKEVPVKDFSLDSEMGEMTKNNLFYQTLLETVVRRNQMARSVIEGR